MIVADQGEAEFLALFRRLSPRRRRAFIRFALRHMNGVPFAKALAKLRQELAL